MTASQHTPAYAGVDLTTCDREPIHVPGAIQPHGVLVAFDSLSYDVVTVSANAGELLGSPAHALLGGPLSTAIGPAATQAVRTAIEAGQLREPTQVVLDLDRGALAGQRVDFNVHRSGHRHVVELEEAQGAGTATAYRAARSALLRLDATGGVAGLADVLAGEIRRLTAFDRVMVYRFDEHWNGEVIAEDKRDDLNSFLGLHYPATDIPAQARRLYTVNWIRLIADIGYDPVPLQPVLDPETSQPLDLSFAGLRSVSPIHVEYLTNMGVTASMSVSLLRDGELWGLIACHHYAGPHRPTLDARSAAELVAQVASGMIADRERTEERIGQLGAERRVGRIVADLAVDPRPLHDALMDHPALLELFGATGAALFAEGRMLTRGTVPERPVLHQIAAALDSPNHVVRSTDHLSELVPDSIDLDDDVAGALRIATNADRWMMWFRPAQVRTVDWGGDPHNKLLAATEGPDVRLSPRKSFDLWRETVRGFSAPWKSWHEDVAEELRGAVSGLLLQRSREQIFLAESVQREVLLDATPDVPGYEVAVRYTPAAENRLGGDWCDAVKMPDGRAAFVVGDVAGHGFTAATTMTQIRTAVRAYLIDGHSPGSCLDRLDHLMAATMPGVTATALVLLLDTATGDGVVATAGHPPPIVAGADGPSRLDVRPRPLLGIGEPDRSEQSVSIGDDTLVLYTDGLIERRDRSIDESLESLVTQVGRRPGGPLAAWVDDLWRTVAEAAGAGADDQTLLVLRRTADD